MLSLSCGTSPHCMPGGAMREQLLESLAEGVFSVDAEGNFTFLNRAACRLLGLADEQVALRANHQEWALHSGPDSQPLPPRSSPIDQVLRTGCVLKGCELRFRHSDGHPVPVLVNAAPLYGEEGRIAGAVVSFQDVRERQVAREALERREAELAEAQQIAHLGSWVSDFVRNEIRWSDEVYRIFGLTPGEWGGTEAAFMEAVHPEDRARVRQAIDESMRPNGPPYDIEHRIQRPDGSVRIVHQKGTVAFDADGRPLRMAGVVHDITEMREAERRLQYLSHHDVLTELPNRTLFQIRLRQAISEAQAEKGCFALVHIGLDRFRSVNEGVGHHAGDQVLQQVARRLEACLRPGETLARLGGDEFAVLLAGAGDDAEVAAGVDRLLAPLQELFRVGEDEFYVPGSAGVALYPHDCSSPGELMQRAEAAMHRAKQEESTRLAYYSAEMNQRARARVALESRLRRAVDRMEGFYLDYQPRVETATGRIIGLEALLRWREGEGPVHSPATFVPVLEQTGLIMELGEWIVGEACRQARAWRQAGLPPVQLAVNLAAPQFRDPAMPGIIEGALGEAGLPPGNLELEVTESMLMREVTSVIDTLGQFRDMGVRVAMDDFGTGYSSLAYLRRFPIDVLKIDRSFVNDLYADESGAAIIRTILSLADNLGMESVAEGVERPEQHAFLCREGCHAVQGYLFSRPASPEVCARMLRRGRLSFEGGGG
ncbi:EAL domain-containing protein [Alkalilimnicola ehrlichii MLHE-1]|nr:EAL domain-containing protein [Alkalilimnicola ehrlichii]